MNKKQLYESIIRQISKEVKKTLNEYELALKMKTKKCRIEINRYSVDFIFLDDDTKNFSIHFDKYKLDFFDYKGYSINKEYPTNYAWISKTRRQFDNDAAANISYLLNMIGCTVNGDMFIGGDNIQTDEIDWPYITISQVDPYHKYDKHTNYGDLDYYIRNIYKK